MSPRRIVIGTVLSAIFSISFGCEYDESDFDESLPGAGAVAGDDGHGLLGAYFNDLEFTDRVFDRVDRFVDFEWGRGSPDSKVDSDTFSVRWSGFVKAEYSQTYTFYTVGDDGIRLYVDDKLVVNDWSNHGPRERSGNIALKAGQLHSIKLEYYESSGGAVARLLWSSPSQTKQVIPEAQLFRTKNDNSGGEAANVALGKPTRQSSTAYRGESSRAVDGNTSGHYGDSSVTHTDFEAGAWWLVELGGAHRVERVVLFNRTDCCGQRLSNFNVDYLDASGKVLATRNYSTQAQTQTEIALAASGVYSVRVQLKGTDALSLAEVQVFGTAGSGTGTNTGTNTGTGEVDADEIQFDGYVKVSRERDTTTNFNNLDARYMLYVESWGKVGHNNISMTQNTNKCPTVEGAELMNVGGGQDKFISLYKINKPNIVLHNTGGSGQVLFIETSKAVKLENVKSLDPSIGSENIKGPKNKNQITVYAEDEGGKDTRDEFFMPKAMEVYGAGDDLVYLFGYGDLSPNNTDGPNGNGAVGTLTFF